MGTFQTFEEIDAWQEARVPTREIYKFTTGEEFARDKGLRDQIRRASVSIVSNIAEGFERDGRKEFLQFLSIAKGSTAEVRAQLYVALDVGMISHAEFDQQFQRCKKVARLISGLMRYLQQSSVSGLKRRPPST